MIKNIPLFRIEQPIGEFFVGKIETKILLDIYMVKSRNEIENDGYQRMLNISRINDIKKYTEDPDAVFPTSIIISVKYEDVKLLSDGSVDGLYYIEFDSSKKRIFEIIDGQHRLCGISKNPDKIKELPIILLFDLTEEQKAYVFSTINSNQRKVSSSLIYDLFDIYETRSPSKTCHELAKTFNMDRNSPFYAKLKMLGRKINGNEIISQGSFVHYLLELITNDPEKDSIDIKTKNQIKTLDGKKYVLREWFTNEEDDKIYKVLFNYFVAASHVFNNEWENTSKYILLKTTGFGALCKSFRHAFNKGVEKGTMRLEFFEELFKISKKSLITSNVEITSKFYGSGEAAQNNLSYDLTKNWIDY